MAQPLFVSPSTTFVQVESLQTPYTAVILNQIQYTGQTFTLLNGTSTTQILYDPIVLSTNAATFQTGAISTLIQQPQGYITVQSQFPSIWNFLNSYPFRDQYISAGAYSLTASSIYTASISSLLDIVSSVEVENLVVTSQFFQSTGLIINTNVSTFGSVDFLSTIRVWGNAFFSSQYSTLGTVSLFSSVYIRDNVTTQSSLVTTDSFHVSDSVYAIGPLTSGEIQLRDALDLPRLEVQASSISSSYVVGFVDMLGEMYLQSTANVYGDLFTKHFYGKDGIQVFSSFTLGSGTSYALNDMNAVALQAVGGLSTLGYFRTGGSVDIGRPSTIASYQTGGGELTIVSSLTVTQNLQVSKSLYINQNLSTVDLLVNNLAIQGDFNSFSTNTQLLALNVGGSFGSLYGQAASTNVGGSVSTLEDFYFFSTSRIQRSFEAQGAVSTTTNLLVSSLSLVGNLDIVGSINIGNNLTVSENVFINDTFYTNVSESVLSSVIYNNLTVLGNLSAQKLTLSTITLTSSLTTDFVDVQVLHVGDKGIAANGIFVSSLVTSSFLASSSIDLFPGYSLDSHTFAALLLSVKSLNADHVSTVFFQTPATTGQNIYIPTSLAIGTRLSTNEVAFLTNQNAYFSSLLFIGQSTSTLFLRADEIRGDYLIGDASLLSNVAIPTSLSASNLITSTLQVLQTIESQSYNGSTITINGIFSPNLFTQINSIDFITSTNGLKYNTYPYDWINPLYSNSYIDTPLAASKNMLFLNNMDIYNSIFEPWGDITDQVVLINTHKFDGGFFNPNQYASNYGPFPVIYGPRLIVGNSLQVRDLIMRITPLPLRGLVGDLMYTSTISPFFSDRNISYIYDDGSSNYPGIPINIDARFELIIPGLPDGEYSNYMSMYVSSGLLGPIPDGAFFLPPGYTPSTGANFIQTHESTITFNSTLFIKRDTHKVGLNTQPNFELDVPGSFSNDSQTKATQNFYIKDQVNFTQGGATTYWYGGGNTNQGDFMFQSLDDGVTWSNNQVGSYQSFVIVNTITWTGYQWFASGISGAGQQYLQSPSLYATHSNWDILPTIFYNANGSLFDGEKLIVVGSSNATSPGKESIILIGPNSNNNFNSNLGLNINATSTDSNLFSQGYGVAWNGSQYVAVGYGIDTNHSILYSYDGYVWSPSSNNTGFVGGQGYCVGWTGKAWVTAGIANGDGVILRSTDGMNWSNVYTGGLQGRSIASDGNITVLVGQLSLIPASTIKYSLDHGNTWQDGGGDISISNSPWPGTAVAYTGEYWLAGGLGVRKSFDGITWFNPSPSFSNALYSLGFFSNISPRIEVVDEISDRIVETSILNRFVVGRDIASAFEMQYSDTGSNFSNGSSQGNPKELSSVTGVAFGKIDIPAGFDIVTVDSYIACGQGSLGNPEAILSIPSPPFFTNIDAVGTSWTPMNIFYPIVPPGLNSVNSVAFGKNGVGDNIVIFLTNYTAGFFNGIWTYTFGSLPQNTFGVSYFQDARGAAYNGSNLWVAVGNDSNNTGSTIVYSSDGSTWDDTGITNAFTSYGIAITYGNGLWVAIGSSLDDTLTNYGVSTIKYSGDGSNWSDVTNYFTGDPGGGFLYGGVGYGNNTFVAASYDSNGNTIKYSGDGANWSNATGSFGLYGTGAAYNQGLNVWVATGNDNSLTGQSNVLYTSDVTTWSNVASGVTSDIYTCVATGGVPGDVVTITSTMKSVAIFDNPAPNVPNLYTGNRFVAYPSSFLNMNDTMYIDTFKNTTIGTYFNQQEAMNSNFTSTLYVAGTIFTSSFVSTSALQIGNYRLSIQVV